MTIKEDNFLYYQHSELISLIRKVIDISPKLLNAENFEALKKAYQPKDKQSDQGDEQKRDAASQNIEGEEEQKMLPKSQ